MRPCSRSTIFTMTKFLPVKFFLFAGMAATLLAAVSCQKEITKQGFELGRKLFYDAKLSRDNTISCGSCHIQTSAFTQYGHIVSHGIDDLLGTRNSQPVVNLAWSTSFFWDGGVFNLDLQPFAPIQNPEEMGADLPTIRSFLSNNIVYPQILRPAGSG